MTNRPRIRGWILLSSICCAVILALLVWYLHHRKPILLQGAVIIADPDTKEELPISGVEVSATDALVNTPVKSDSSGFFSIQLRRGMRRGQTVTLTFRHPDYHPLELQETIVNGKLCIARMVPIPRGTPHTPTGPVTTVSNVRVRFTIKATTVVNVGSVVRTFQIENKGDVPCHGQHPCSPDGRWKAALGSTSLDAEAGNEFRDARVSCIAGPCPFTKIEKDDFSEGGRTISVTARNWSDTATFLLEAEVVHSMVSDVTHVSYPVIFGSALNFTLLPAAEGVTIEADLNGQTIIFPMGPALFLSWAECDARINRDQTKVYRCELKPGYRFR